MSAARLVKYMSAVNAYRERLASVQGSWDTLSLLSHLGGSGNDMSGTRAAFESLATTLLESLAAESRNKSILGLKSKAQIAVDIIVRNLYERTADIGFLCADEDLKEFVLARRTGDATKSVGADVAARQSSDETSSDDRTRRMRQRLREYVAKYSVYQDVIVLDPQGRVLLQLDSDHPIEHSQDPLIAETLAGRAGYVETFRSTDLAKHRERSLIYSGRIMDADRPIGVLCLSFRFEDEVAAIFAKLQTSGDWTVLTYLDAHDEVIATSDAHQIPLGAKLTAARAPEGDVIRFAGREFLAVTCATQGYQGYAGPGWQGHALLPLEHAFDAETQTFTRDIAAPVLAQLRDSQALFSQALQKIPQQAQMIQRELNRSVWNGNIALAARSDSRDDFSKVLLREIANTGVRTQGIFESSIVELHETVLSKVMEDARQFASLALDILDRNLYERANDCRWWALNGTLKRALGSNAASAAAAGVLRQINDLYTVYDGLVLFDTTGRIVAISNPAYATRVGERIDEPWVRQTLSLRDSQSYAVSSFAASTLYGDRHTYIFGAAIRGDDHKILGGIGIVFDREAQLSAMLQDALPHTAGGSQAECMAFFVDDRRQVVAATSRYQPGDTFDLPVSFSAEQTRGVQVITLNGTHYAMGFCTASGYREFAGLGIQALILVPLGPEVAVRAAPREVQPRAVQNRGTTQHRTVDIATFYADGQWLGVRRDQIVAAIDASNLHSIPARPAWHAGVLIYQDTPVSVIDVARFTGSGQRSEGRDVIVLRDNHDSNKSSCVGLLVGQLADISEIEEREILPVKGVLLDGQRSIIDHAVRPSQPEDPVLFILDIAALFAQVRSTTAAR